MPRSERELREDIVEIGRLMYEKAWVAANDGNISVRLDESRILCTPTGLSKGRMKPDDLIICDARGDKICGFRQRTSEILMHVEIYRLRPEIGAVVHAHPPAATGFAAAGRALDRAVLPEVVVSLGAVPLAPYGLPGTSALTEPLLPLIPKFDAILLANHGAVAYDEDLFQAFHKLEIVEHTARVTLVAELLGGANVLPRAEVEKLVEARGRYGVPGRAPYGPGCPITAEDLE